jgi:hypothetical protein
VYEWRNASGYAANLTSDERQAKLISKRVVKTLAEMNLAEARTFHDRTRREYYIMEGGRALVYGYFTDAWYLYDPFPLTHLFERDGELYGAGGECGFVRFSRRYQSDGGEKIDACWRSGAMAFGADFRRKHSARVFIVMKPEQRSHITVSAVTDSGGITGGETVSVGLSGFSDADFRHWSFGTNRAPHTRKLRIRTRKFAFYQLLLTSGNDWSTATVLGADVRLRAAGQVR